MLLRGAIATFDLWIGNRVVQTEPRIITV